MAPVAPALQTQAVEAALAAGEVERVGHAWQVAGDVAPMVGENFPAAQLVHAPPNVANLPVAQLVQSLSASDPAGEDLPAAQLVHTPPAAANLPAAQAVQSLPASDPAGEDLPAAQLVHAASPTDGLKLPAAHASHAPPSGPVKPGVHVHDASDALP
ncbi:MAG: hypothetical protein ACPIOQ_81950, partial [Promethearchaeia archaeon]